MCKEVRPKESPDPHIFLVCGSELSRGCDFNKKHHRIQKHPDHPTENYSSKIGAKDHELAQKNEKQDGKSKSEKTTKPSTSEKSLEVPVSKVASGLQLRPWCERHFAQHASKQLYTCGGA